MTIPGLSENGESQNWEETDEERYTQNREEVKQNLRQKVTQGISEDRTPSTDDTTIACNRKGNQTCQLEHLTGQTRGHIKTFYLNIDNKPDY